MCAMKKKKKTQKKNHFFCHMSKKQTKKKTQKKRTSKKTTKSGRESFNREALCDKIRENKDFAKKVRRVARRFEGVEPPPLSAYQQHVKTHFAAAKKKAENELRQGGEDPTPLEISNKAFEVVAGMYNSRTATPKTKTPKAAREQSSAGRRKEEKSAPRKKEEKSAPRQGSGARQEGVRNARSGPREMRERIMDLEGNYNRTPRENLELSYLRAREQGASDKDLEEPLSVSEIERYRALSRGEGAADPKALATLSFRSAAPNFAFSQWREGEGKGLGPQEAGQRWKALPDSYKRALQSYWIKNLGGRAARYPMSE